MKIAAVLVLVGCCASVCAVAHAEPMRPVQKTVTRSDLLAEIASEERAITTLLAEIAELESRRRLAERERARLSAAGSIVLPALEPTSNDRAAMEALLKKELAGIGIPLTAEEASSLVRAMGKGDEAGMAVALALVATIAEASSTPTKTDVVDAGAPKPATSRYAGTVKRLAASAAGQAAVAPATVGPIVDEIVKAPGAVPVQRAELTPAMKPARVRAGDHVLAVATKSYATYVANLTASIETAKTNVSERRRRISVLQQRLDALGPDQPRVMKP